MSITLLIFFLINFHFMEKNGYYRDFFHSLSSNCTIKYENFRSFDFQSDMKLQFLYPIRFMYYNFYSSSICNCTFHTVCASSRKNSSGRSGPQELLPMPIIRASSDSKEPDAGSSSKLCLFLPVLPPCNPKR